MLSKSTCVYAINIRAHEDLDALLLMNIAEYNNVLESYRKWYYNEEDSIAHSRCIEIDWILLKCQEEDC